MIAGLYPSSELLRTHYMRVDLPPESGGYAGKELAELAETGLAEDHKINIALRLVGTVGHRAKDKGQSYASPVECFAQNVRQTAGLEDNVPYFGIEGMLRVRPVIEPISIFSVFDYATSNQPLEFLADGRVVQS